MKQRLRIPKLNEDVKTKNIIPILNDNIKEILSEVVNLQSEDINKTNEEEVKEVLNKSDMIIVECHTTETFIAGKNGDFARLMYEYQRLKLKYESHQLNGQITFIKEEHELIKEEQEEIKKQQSNLKDESSNLVYNILGFIASFSIVSAAVSAIQEIKSLSSIMLFMAFTAFILLTTLIGLNNFYRKNEKKIKLQDNYFLWKMMLFVIIVLIIYSGIEYVKNNLEYILEHIGRGIGQTINLVEESNNSEHKK